ncbi:hypothetical protein IAR50_005829 [Cryptococcus sp. DSM 104548]
MAPVRKGISNSPHKAFGGGGENKKGRGAASSAGRKPPKRSQNQSAVFLVETTNELSCAGGLLFENDCNQCVHKGQPCVWEPPPDGWLPSTMRQLVDMVKKGSVPETVLHMKGKNQLEAEAETEDGEHRNDEEEGAVGDDEGGDEDAEGEEYFEESDNQENKQVEHQFPTYDPAVQRPPPYTFGHQPQSLPGLIARNDHLPLLPELLSPPVIGVHYSHHGFLLPASSASYPLANHAGQLQMGLAVQQQQERFLLSLGIAPRRLPGQGDNGEMPSAATSHYAPISTSSEPYLLEQGNHLSAYRRAPLPTLMITPPGPEEILQYSFYPQPSYDTERLSLPSRDESLSAQRPENPAEDLLSLQNLSIQTDAIVGDELDGLFTEDSSTNYIIC